MRMNLRTCVQAAIALGSAALPALAGPFDSPFLGRVDAQIVSMNLTGSVSGYAVSLKASPGSGGETQIVSDGGGGGGRIIADSFFDVFFELSIGPLHYSPSTINLKLVPSGHPFPPPPGFPPPNIPIPDVNPLPPVGERYMDNPDLAFSPDFVLTAIVQQIGTVTNRQPIVDGERVTYDSAATMAVTMQAGNRFGLPGGYALLLGLSGPVTVDMTPEPGALALLGLGALLGVRCRRTR